MLDSKLIAWLRRRLVNRAWRQLNHIGAFPVDFADGPWFHGAIDGNHPILAVYIDNIDGYGHKHAMDTVTWLDQRCRRQAAVRARQSARADASKRCLPPARIEQCCLPRCVLNMYHLYFLLASKRGP